MTDGSFAQGLVGVTLDGRYRLDAVVGEGGMGSVFRATQLAMDRKVAVKLLKPHLTSDEGALQRFAREARATLKVDSPHAVKVLDFGVTPQRDYYMVLEYLDGRTVHRELEIDGPFDPPRVAHIARQALHALGAAHDRGLIHRDVKPDNLLLMRAGTDADYTKILDFGVAKLMQGAAGDPAQLALTAAGMVFGTPEFMSPEQACGQALDGRSDLYSLGATMFVMLTGTALFEGKTAIELLTHHARTPPPHLAMVRPELAAYAELDRLLQRCLAKHREQRPPSAAAMAALIEHLEPTLAECASSARQPAPVDKPPTPPPVFHSSSYFEALRDTDPATAAPLQTGAGASTPLTASLPRARTRPRRRLGLWLGGAALASVVGLAIGLGMRKPASTNASIAASSGAVGSASASTGGLPAGPGGSDGHSSASLPGSSPGNGAAPGSAASPPSGRVSTGANTVGANPVGGSSTSAGGSSTAAGGNPASGASSVGSTGSAPRHIAAPVRSAVVAEHLRNAEEAFRAGNHIRQIAEADLALHDDPRNVRARYLVGDGLIKTGDLDRGCRYLRALKRNLVARDRARTAGCAGD